METAEREDPSVFVIPLIRIFVGVILFVALLYGQRELTLLSILVLGMVSLAKLWSKLALSRVECRTSIDKQRAFPGEKLTLNMSAKNAKFLPIWLRMEAPVDASLHPYSEESRLAKESGLLWYQRVRFQWELAAQRRGVHRIGPSIIIVADCLGFFRRKKKIDESLDVIVYPRLVPVKPFPVPRRDFFGIPGARSPVQDPIYILGTRDYHHRQPAKYIHWKASARHHRLQEKIFEPSEQEKVLFALNVEPFSRNGNKEAFERSLEVLASLAVSLDRKGYAIGLVTNGLLEGGGSGVLPMAKTRQQLSAFLEILARMKMEVKEDLVHVLRTGLTLPWGSSCIHLSYENDEANSVAEHYLAYRKIPTVFLVCQRRPKTGSPENRLQSRVFDMDDIMLQEAVL